MGYRDGLSWHLHALKTRKPRFQTTYSHQSLLCQLWPHGLIPVCWIEFVNYIGRNVIVASKSGPVETVPTILVATALKYPKICPPLLLHCTHNSIFVPSSITEGTHWFHVPSSSYTFAHLHQVSLLTGLLLMVLGVYVTQDFSDPWMVARVLVRSCLLVCPSIHLFTASSLPPSKGCNSGMYLSINITCLPCPANSNSTQRGLSECPCFAGYFRADGEPPERERTRK